MKIIQYQLILICSIFFSSCESEIRNKDNKQSLKIVSTLSTTNEMLSASNDLEKLKNNKLYKSFKDRTLESPDQYSEIFKYTRDLKEKSEILDTYLKDTRKKIEEIIKSTDYGHSKEESNVLFDSFYDKKELDVNGIEFLDHIDNYRNGMEEMINGMGMKITIQELEINFNTDKYRNISADNNSILKDQFKNLTLIELLTKIIHLQYKITTIENDILSTWLLGQLTVISSAHNYSTILTSKKESYYNGDIFNGEILLTRVDANTVPNEIELKLDGQKLNYNKDFTYDIGRIILNIPAGKPGKHRIEGSLTFVEYGDQIIIPINSVFTTKQKPN